MALVDFNESFLHMDVLCVRNYLNYTLAGIGSHLFVYDNRILKISKRIFIGERIHSICSKNDTILLKGGKQLAFVCLSSSSGQVSCQIISKIQCLDWIQDVIILDKCSVGLTTAHNLFQMWDLTSGKCLKVYSCEENCILYSCKIVGDSLEKAVVLSGTVFGDIVIWAPFLNDEKSLLHRLKGHNGAIFSIEVDVGEKILSTTSDDRSLRIWSITAEDPILHVNTWKNAKIQLIHTLYGHTARVWRSLIISEFYVTIGEDSQLIIWKRDGRLMKSLSLHQESGIRALHYSEETKTIITGGEDGGINRFSWEFLTSELKPSGPGKSVNIGQNFSTRVCFVKNGMVYTTSGGASLFKNEHEEVLYKNENFSTYCLLEVSSEGDHIILGSIKGHLVVINVETKIVLTEDKFINGRVYSIHWLNGHLLTSGPDGRLDLWEYSKGALKNVKVMSLPNCRERWTTCGVIHEDNLVVGDRMGNLHVYELKGGENPVQSFRKIHSYLGVTDILNEGSSVFTVGRDGTFKTFTDVLFHSTTYKLPMEWPWKIVRYNEDVLILGFHSVSFVVWSMNHREIIASHDCGGGHRSCDYKLEKNKLSFLYVKEKQVFTVDLNLDDVTRVRKGFHGKEINCLRMLQTETRIIVTGSEDTILRISRIEKSEIEEIHVLKTHISSIRAIAICSMTPETVLIVSVGGKSQLVIWTFDLKLLKCREMVNYRVRKETQNWKCTTPVVDPETRFMCVDVIKLENEFLIAAGCSDCQIKIFSYNESLNLLCSISYTHCILNIAILKVDSRLLVASMGTDGKVVFWNVTDCSNVSQLGQFSLHQSGINCFHFEEVECGRFVLATGGDDNLISIALVKISEKGVDVTQEWKTSTIHSCQVTGIQILKNILITTSIDQRITVWNWLLDEDKVEVNFIDQYMSSVPDIQGMEARWCKDHEILIFAHGKGMEMLKVDV